MLLQCRTSASAAAPGRLRYHAGYDEATVTMAGLTPDTPVPTQIVVHRKSRELEIAFSDGLQARLSFEFLRVHSPSAEVQGHGPGQETLQTGKREVDILAVDPVGNYAIQPRFSDGHESGIYSWDWLYRFAKDHERMWQTYLDRLAAAGASRDVAPAAQGERRGYGGAAAPRPEAAAVVRRSGDGATPGFDALAVSRPRNG